MKIEYLHFTQLAAGLVLLFAFLGCDVTDHESSDVGRLVLGESVDGVGIGSDSLSVRGRLGVPAQIQRGNRFVMYRYTRAPHAGLSIQFGLDANGSFDGSTSFSLSAPYRGKTAQGVGLGSSRAAVIRALGEPDFSNVGTSGLIHDRYESQRARTGFLYDEDELVSGITMHGPL